jgi:hypothetical protein
MHARIHASLLYSIQIPHLFVFTGSQQYLKVLSSIPVSHNTYSSLSSLIAHHKSIPIWEHHLCSAIASSMRPMRARCVKPSDWAKSLRMSSTCLRYTIYALKQQSIVYIYMYVCWQYK